MGISDKWPRGPLPCGGGGAMGWLESGNGPLGKGLSWAGKPSGTRPCLKVDEVKPVFLVSQVGRQGGRWAGQATTLVHLLVGRQSWL